MARERRGKAQAEHTEATLDPGRPLASAELPSSRFLAVYEIGKQLLEQREPAQVLATIHAAILQHLAPDHACVLGVEKDGALRPVLSHALDLSGPQAQWPISSTVVQRVLADGLAVLASDVRQDAKFSGSGSIQRFRIRSVMCVPLGKPARGVLYVDNRSERPFKPEDLEFLTAVSRYAALVFERSLEHAQTSEALARSGDEVEALRSELLRHEIVGASKALLDAFDALSRFARSGARVMIRGETGTGKELFARAYAAASGRLARAYVPVTIPALSPGLVESELFGHVRGAFTEATRDKKGRLEVAHGGVLFLDEVGDIEPNLQTKLLRFLDSGELYRVGDTQPRRVDALVVSATNRPLEKDVADGRFRADLLARLGHAVRLPPLRERLEDVPLLVEHFLRRFDRGTPPKRFAPETLEILMRHSWPFNVRELQQVVERTTCLVDRDAAAARRRRRSGAEPHPEGAGLHEGQQAQGDRAAEGLARDVLPAARGVRPAQEGRARRRLGAFVRSSTGVRQSNAAPYTPAIVLKHLRPRAVVPARHPACSMRRARGG
jgi:transcriptional regulator with GAF, ATPase, and Fis domain